MKTPRSTLLCFAIALSTASFAACTSKSDAQPDPSPELGQACVVDTTNAPGGNCAGYLECVGGACVTKGTVGTTCSSHSQCAACDERSENCVTNACVEGACAQSGEVIVGFERCAVTGALQSTTGTTTSPAPTIRGCMVRYRVRFEAPNAISETTILLSTTAADDLDNPANGSIVIRTSAILGAPLSGGTDTVLVSPASGTALSSDNAEMLVVSATGAKDYAEGKFFLLDTEDPWFSSRTLTSQAKLAIDAQFGLVLPDIAEFGDVTVTSDGSVRTLAGDLKITTKDGTEPVPASVGSCTDVASGVCTELVKGDLANFEQSCLKDGDNNARFAEAPCSTTADFVCKNGTGTDNVTSDSITINVYWPAGYCASNPSQNLPGTCSKGLSSDDWTNNAGCREE